MTLTLTLTLTLPYLLIVLAPNLSESVITGRERIESAFYVKFIYFYFLFFLSKKYLSPLAQTFDCVVAGSCVFLKDDDISCPDGKRPKKGVFGKI
jgi:hypothetical protein